MSQSEQVPEWAKVEACKRLNEEAGDTYYWLPDDDESHSVLVVARFIAEHEEPPVDPLLIEAREIAANACEKAGNKTGALLCRKGEWDSEALVTTALTALRRGIELSKDQTHEQ